MTDNTSNNIAFLRAIENIFAESNIEFNACNQHIRCLVHIINLAVQKILQVLNAENNIELENNIQPTGVISCLLYKVSFLFKI
jgi:hypothetical protein